MGLMNFAAALGVASSIEAPAHAAVTAISSAPDAGYVGATNLLNIAIDDYETLTSLGDGNLTISFERDDRPDGRGVVRHLG